MTNQNTTISNIV